MDTQEEFTKNLNIDKFVPSDVLDKRTAQEKVNSVISRLNEPKQRKLRRGVSAESIAQVRDEPLNQEVNN